MKKLLPIPSMTEAIVLEAQKLLILSPTLVKRVVMHLERFSSRQIVILLNSLSKTDPPQRRLMHQLIPRVDPKELTLRDFAVTLNVFARMGIKNELFLVSNEVRIRRKIASTLDMSALVLLLAGCTKLQLVGDGKLVDSILDRLDTGTLKSTEAVSVCVSLARLGSPTVNKKLMEHIVASIDPEHAGSALASLCKMAATPRETLLNLEIDFLKSLPNLSLFHKIQGFQALTVFHRQSIQQHSSITKVFDVIATQLKTEENVSTGTLILFLSSMNRAAEILRIGRILSALKLIDLSSLCAQGTAVYLNLLSTINLQPSPAFSLAPVFTASDGHTVALSVNALAKLDRNTELLALLRSVSPTIAVRSMSEQGIDMCVLAIANLIDLKPEAFLMEWLKVLLQNKRSYDASIESVSQLRIASVILQNQNLFDISKLSPISKTCGKISAFHQEVSEALSAVPAVMNTVDASTGYEIDICLPP